MSKVIKLKKGLDIKLNGEAEKVVQPAGKITSCALKPTDFRAMTPKLAVKVGDEVKAGDVLFIDKTHPEIKFTTPEVVPLKPSTEAKDVNYWKS